MKLGDELAAINRLLAKLVARGWTVQRTELLSDSQEGEYVTITLRFDPLRESDVL